MNARSRVSGYMVLLLILISAANQLRYDWFYRPFQIENHRAGFEFFAKNRQPGDVLFVHYNAAPTVGHAVRFFPEKYPFGKEFVRLETWQPEPNFLQKEVSNWRKAHQSGRIFIQWAGKMTETDAIFFDENYQWIPVFEYRGGKVFESKILN